MMPDQYSDDIAPSAASVADQRAYFIKRAADHEALAGKAGAPGIRSLHLQLQALYQQRVDRPEMIHTD